MKMPGNEACDDRHGQSISLRRLTTGWVSRNRGKIQSSESKSEDTVVNMLCPSCSAFFSESNFRKKKKKKIARKVE